MYVLVLLNIWDINFSPKMWLEIATNKYTSFQLVKDSLRWPGLKVLENFQNFMNYNGALLGINFSQIPRLTRREKVVLLKGFKHYINLFFIRCWCLRTWTCGFSFRRKTMKSSFSCKDCLEGCWRSNSEKKVLDISPQYSFHWGQ